MTSPRTKALRETLTRLVAVAENHQSDTVDALMALFEQDRQSFYAELEALLHDEDDEVMAQHGYSQSTIDARNQLKAELRADFNELRTQKENQSWITQK